jgi:hypothetical protein
VSDTWTPPHGATEESHEFNRTEVELMLLVLKMISRAFTITDDVCISWNGGGSTINLSQLHDVWTSGRVTIEAVPR